MCRFIQFLFLFFLIIFYVNNSAPVFAQEQKEVVIVNPIRGSDFWDHKFDLLDTPKKQYELIKANNLSSTWLIRYDALIDKDVEKFLKSLDKNQEIGIFLEITPSLTKDSGVIYNQSPNWHYARSVLLIGYDPEDRRKMIDAVMSKYRSIFNKYPKSVGAWWIDAGSLVYMKEKYGVSVNLDVADQYSTDQYQVWGQYFSLPFYPSKQNALMPAQNNDQKIGVVTIQWATRDPYNAYGNGVGDSTYSVQANDYVLHDLGIDYFGKLLDIYPQITVGLENDFSWDEFGGEYTEQINLLVSRQKRGDLTVLRMDDFLKSYLSRYPNLSPAVLISAGDPLGSEGRVVWYQNTRYRVGWFYGAYGSVIRDLRLFNASNEEPCLRKSCDSLDLARTESKALDDVTYATRWVIDEGRISDFNITSANDERTIELTYLNQGGQKRLIKFLENDIQIDNQIQPVSFAILNAITDPSNQAKTLDQKYNEGFIIWDKVLGRLLADSFKFLIFTIFFFFIVGYLITRDITFAIPVGWGIFTISVWGLGYLNLELLIWLLPFISLILMAWKKIYPRRSDFSKPNLLLILIVIVGSVSWLITTYKSGLFFNFGLGYWGPNGHDGIWHLSVISELQRGSLPLSNPIYAGEMLTNYHYFFNILVARTGTLMNIDNQHLLFRFFPIFISLLAGFGFYKVVLLLARYMGLSSKRSRDAGLTGLMFLYFGGSFGWVISYFRNNDFGGESMFWSQQSISTLLNPPYAISLVLLLTGLYYFILYREQLPKLSLKDLIHMRGLNWKSILPIIICWGILIEFKAYAGVLVLIGLLIVFLEELIFKRDIKTLPILLLCGLLSLLVFLPNNVGSNSLFVWKPFWLIETMIDFQDRLYWQRLSLALHSEVFTKVFLSYVIGFGIFMLGNLGTRVISLFAINKAFKFKFLLYIWLVGLILPMLFIQKGTNWNIVQFFYYTLFISNIFSGIALAILISRIGWKLGAILVIIIGALTIPTTLNTSSQYIPSLSSSRLPYSEYEALMFLRSQEEGTILSLAFDPKLKDRFASPLPLVAYVSTAYVSAFSNKPSFIEDTVNLDILGIDYKGRINLQREITKNKDLAFEILRDNNIKYLYIHKAYETQEDEGRMGIKKIFENSDVKIYKRN